MNAKFKRLITYSTNKFPTEYVPTVFDNYGICFLIAYCYQIKKTLTKSINKLVYFWNKAVDLVISGQNYTLALFDTAGQEGFDQLRPIAYPQTDIFLVCFSTVFPTSLVNIQKHWISEIKKYCPSTPFLLVGTKIDLRNNPDEIGFYLYFQ